MVRRKVSQAEKYFHILTKISVIFTSIA